MGCFDSYGWAANRNGISVSARVLNLPGMDGFPRMRKAFPYRGTAASAPGASSGGHRRNGSASRPGAISLWDPKTAESGGWGGSEERRGGEGGRARGGA